MDDDITFWSVEQHLYMSRHEDELRAVYDTPEEQTWLESEEYQRLFGNTDLLTLFGKWDDWND